MDNVKLYEALEDLEARRSTIDSAIKGLRGVIAQLEGSPQEQPGRNGTHAPAPTSGQQKTKTYVDYCEDGLTSAGKPLHILDLYELVGDTAAKELGKDVTKESLEATLITHYARVKSPRIIRVGPSVWGLAGRDTPESSADVA